MIKKKYSSRVAKERSIATESIMITIVAQITEECLVTNSDGR